MKYKLIALALVTLMFIPLSSKSWDGFDYDKGSHVAIEKGNLVREGSEIEYFDYGEGQYKSGTVESIDSSGNIEVYDYETGESRQFDMD